jgi:hypothetical protein
MAAAAIFGEDWAGNSSLSLLSRSLSSASGSECLVSIIWRPSVVGISMSISCRAANFSRTPSRGGPWGERGQPSRQSGVETIGEEGNEDVRFDARLEVMEDGADCEIALEIPESLFDPHELEVIAPPPGGIVIDQIGAQEIASLAPLRLAQLVAIEAEAESRLPGINVDPDEAVWARARAAPSFISSSWRDSFIVLSCLSLARAI